MLDVVERLEGISEMVKLGIIDADLVDDMIDELLLKNLEQHTPSGAHTVPRSHDQS